MGISKHFVKKHIKFVNPYLICTYYANSQKSGSKLFGGQTSPPVNVLVLSLVVGSVVNHSRSCLQTINKCFPSEIEIFFRKKKWLTFYWCYFLPLGVMRSDMLHMINRVVTQDQVIFSDLFKSFSNFFIFFFLLIFFFIFCLTLFRIPKTTRGST